MKAKIYLLFIIVFFQSNLFAQDIIIKSNNDTLNCIITEVSDEFIKYQIFDGYNLVFRKIDSSKFIDYKEGFYQQTETNKGILKMNHSHLVISNSYDTIYCNVLARPTGFIVYDEVIDGKKIISKKRKVEIAEITKIKKTKTYNYSPNSYFEISFQGGYGSRTGSIPDDYSQAEKQISKELNSGYYLGGGFRVYPIRQFGFGINYSRYTSKTSGYVPIEYEEETEYYDADMKLSISYVSAEILFTFYTKNNNLSFSPFLNFGLIKFKETTEIGNVEITAKGDRFGWGIGGNIIYYMTPNFGFMLKAQAINGTLSKVTVTAPNLVETIEFPEDEILSIGRLELGGGFVIKI